MSGLYYRCPTCRTVLADKQILYEQGMRKISNRVPALSNKQKIKAQEKLLDDWQN